MSEPERPTYRFKWVNFDLERQVDECKARASTLRREAAVLVMRAEVIENEAEKWKSMLEECTDADPDR